MKKLLLYVLAFVVAAAAVYFAATVIDDRYQQKIKTQPAPVKTITQTESDKKIAEVKAAAAAENRALVDSFNQQTAECQKGKVAYDKLSPALRNQTSPPLCSPARATAE